MKLENGEKVEVYEVIVNFDEEMRTFRHFLAKLSQYKLIRPVMIYYFEKEKNDVSNFIYQS